MTNVSPSNGLYKSEVKQISGAAKRLWVKPSNRERMAKSIPSLSGLLSSELHVEAAASKRGKPAWSDQLNSLYKGWIVNGRQ